MEFLTVFLRGLVMTLFVIIVGRVIMNWIDPTFSGRIGRFLFETTEPLLSPVRRFMPDTGALDLAPLVVLLVLGVLARVALGL